MPHITGADGPAEFALNWAFWGEEHCFINVNIKTYVDAIANINTSYRVLYLRFSNLALSPAVGAVVFWVVGGRLGDVERVKVQTDLGGNSSLLSTIQSDGESLKRDD